MLGYESIYHLISQFYCENKLYPFEYLLSSSEEWQAWTLIYLTYLSHFDSTSLSTFC
jgi:hypothetical protein